MTATIRGADLTIELYLSGAWVDITCDTTTAEWQWGAPEALGPLTECEGGTLRVSLWDPDRDYDPDNPDSPLLGVLKVGLGMRVTVDGSPAWTGVLQTWAWDRASSIADLNGLDPIGMLSVRALPERFTMAPVSTTSAGQAQYLLDFVEWPAGKRYFPDGTSGIERGNHYVEGSVLDGLNRIRFAELGRLFPLRDGGIGWYDRDGPAPPAPSAVINCGGVGLTDMWRVMGLGRLRNRVVISGGYGVFGHQLPPDEYRTVTTSAEFLALAYPGLPTPLPWDLWAQTILDALDPPPVLTMLGTIVPVDDEVAQIVTAEFGDRWTVASAGDPDKVVQVLGQRVTVAPGTIEVDVVTEDIAAPVPTVHRMVGTGSGWLMSQDTISYANARAGSGVTVTIPTGGAPQYQIGQVRGGASLWQVYETFIWFDTSAIPVGATILSAEFAAMFHPHWNGLTPPPAEWVHFDVELRAGYAWLPTLAVADWRPGAGIAASYPLRATINTARAIKDSFATFEDAGSGLAGAIVKGGQTQLFLVSSRTTVGTEPSATTVFEDLYIDFPRLRVKYTTATVTRYRDAIMATSGLVGYWRLGESSGTVAADSKGTNTGTYVGGPSFGVVGATADTDTAVNLNGTSQSISVPDSASLDVGDAFTLEVWAKFTTLTGVGVLFSKGSGGFYMGHIDSTLYIAKRGAALLGQTGAILTTGAWHHIVWTKNGATNALYLNGAAVTPAISNQAIANTALPLLIGQDTGDYVDGSLDEVAIYSRALSAAEVSAHYAARL